MEHKAVVGWLAMVCLVIITMIAVGGATRLTHSGLSMVDWKPLSGIVPPLNNEQWQAEFDQYKQFPEYQLVNKGMSLDEFKSIFYWEYGHRVLGRVIGILFFVPFVGFLVAGKLDRRLTWWLAGGLVLGGLQGLMGWYMVKSGLVDVPRVSHYRLAAHLGLAMLILAYLYWIILDLIKVPVVQVAPTIRRVALVTLSLLVIQILFGAFTAGLKAGFGFNTYPLMDGRFIAEAATMMAPLWLNFFENGAMVQFVHRWLGILVLGGVVGLSTLLIRGAHARGLAVALLLVTGVQVLLGIATLVSYVPISLAIMHQVVACFVLLVMVQTVYSLRT